MTHKEVPFEEQFEAYLKMQGERKQRLALERYKKDSFGVLKMVLDAHATVSHLEASFLELQEKTQDELNTFFGKKVAIPKPPHAFLEAKKRIEDKGVRTFDPIYFPDAPFVKEAEYPGWIVRPSQEFWQASRWQPNMAQAQRQGYKGMNALKGCWALIDKSKRPGYNDGQQIFDDDPLKPILEELREKVNIDSVTTSVPHASRFGIPPHIQDTYVFPRLVNEWNLTNLKDSGKLNIGRLTGMEFNFAGNLRYNHFGESDTAEWLQDICGVPDYGPRMDVVMVYGHRLIGGSSRRGGLEHIDLRQSDSNLVLPYNAIAFRPVIKFAQEE